MFCLLNLTQNLKTLIFLSLIENYYCDILHMVINMKVTGIVVEYNPFHNGHQHHIDKTRELTNCDVLIAVMSGNWVQRGEAAIVDKWERAKFACTRGVDLVVELPYIYSTQSASQFAYGAISTLKLLNVDSIVFGSEIDNIDELKEISELSFDIDRFKENLNEGYSYAKSYGNMAVAYGPNDILAIAYLKEIANTKIKPYSIKRTNDYHGLELSNISSASAIRNALSNNQDVSVATPMSLAKPYTWDDYYPYLQTLLLTSKKEDLRKILLVSEGIENHLIKQAKVSTSYEEFINNCVVKRYTKSRIQRTLTQLLTQTTKHDKERLPQLQHIRIRSYNETGKKYLNSIKKKEDLIIASKFTQIPEEYREIEYKAAVAYAIPYSLEERKVIIEKEIYGQYK